MSVNDFMALEKCMAQMSVYRELGTIIFRKEQSQWRRKEHKKLIGAKKHRERENTCEQKFKWKYCRPTPSFVYLKL